MKIAIVIYNLANGGAEKVASELSKCMSLEHQVKIITFDSSIDYSYSGDIINLNIPSKKGKINKLLNIVKRVYKLKKVYKNEKFDKVFSFMESANIPSLIANKKTLVSIRNNPNIFDRLTSFIIKKLYRRADKIIVNSYANKEILRKKYYLNNISVIKNPIDLENINILSKESIELDYKYILAVGRLNYQKGFDMLIKSYSLMKNNNDVKLVILGEGEEYEKLVNLISLFGLEDKVILLGRKKNPYKYMKNAEFFVLSSRYEGYPNVLVEALSCKTPVISFDCETGPSEIIVNNINGLLVESNNIKELSMKMDTLLSNKSLQYKFSNNALSSIYELKIDKIVKEWINV